MLDYIILGFVVLIAILQIFLLFKDDLKEIYWRNFYNPDNIFFLIVFIMLPILFIFLLFIIK